MKYQTSIEINMSRDRFLEILEDPEGMKNWQPGLLSYEFLDEDRKSPGARMRLIYDMNGKRLEMIETLQERSLPDTMTFTYEAKGVWNRTVNRFELIEPDRVRWTQFNEFRCRGLMAVICFLLPGSFRRETARSLERFKTYAEGLS